MASDSDSVLTDAEVIVATSAPHPENPIEAIAMIANGARLLGWDIVIKFDPPNDPAGHLQAMVLGESEIVRNVQFPAAESVSPKEQETGNG